MAPAAVGAVAAATTESLPNPGDTKNCADFEYFEEAKIFFDKCTYPRRDSNPGLVTSLALAHPVCEPFALGRLSAVR